MSPAQSSVAREVALERGLPLRLSHRNHPCPGNTPSAAKKLLGGWEVARLSQPQSSATQDLPVH